MWWLLRVLDVVGVALSAPHLRYSFRRRVRSEYTYERVWEYGFALRHLAQHRVLDVLDVGSGTNAFPATLQHCRFNVTASDAKGSYWFFFQNRHVHVVRDDITRSHHATASFDAVTCISTLEHIAQVDAALDNMVRVVRDNGLLVLSFPYSHAEYCPNVYALPTADAVSRRFRYVAQSFCDSQIARWCERWGLFEEERLYVRGWEGAFWRSGSRLPFPAVVERKEDANCVCLALVKRR